MASPFWRVRRRFFHLRSWDGVNIEGWEGDHARPVTNVTLTGSKTIIEGKITTFIEKEEGPPHSNPGYIIAYLDGLTVGESTARFQS